MKRKGVLCSCYDPQIKNFPKALLCGVSKGKLLYWCSNCTKQFSRDFTLGAVLATTHHPIFEEGTGMSDA